MQLTRAGFLCLSVFIWLNGCEVRPQPGLIGTWTQSTVTRLNDPASPAEAPTFLVKATELLIDANGHATLQHIQINGSGESIVNTAHLQWFGDPLDALTFTDGEKAVRWKATLVADTTLEFEQIDGSAEILLLLKEEPTLFPNDTGHRLRSPASDFVAQRP